MLEFAAILLCPIATLVGILLFGFACWRVGKRAAWGRSTRPHPTCMHCGYAMKGLFDARCPECGASYTLDELWNAQRDLPTDNEGSPDPPR
jgi:hypothetical protein